MDIPSQGFHLSSLSCLKDTDAGTNASTQKTEREPAECPPTSLKYFTVYSYSDRAFLAPSDEPGRSMDMLGFCELRFAGSLDPTGAFSF